nr:nucleotidyltransferase family protein [Alicyclobacillus fastidiosus]
MTRRRGHGHESCHHGGGKGTRLQPLTRLLPKPMLQLLDRPTLEYIVELLGRHDFHDITMTVCYMADAIRNYFADGSAWDVHIRYQDELVPLGTAGGVRALHAHLDDTFIVMSGDGLTDFDLSEAMRAHRRGGAVATLLLTRVECPLGYGVVEIDVNGRITGFVEKPQAFERDRTYLVNTGIYILEPTIFQWIPTDRPYDFGRELFPLLLELGVPMQGYVASGYWSDVGTLQQYYQTQIDMLNGRVKVNLPVEVASAR